MTIQKWNNELGIYIDFSEEEIKKLDQLDENLVKNSKKFLFKHKEIILGLSLIILNVVFTNQVNAKSFTSLKEKTKKNVFDEVNNLGINSIKHSANDCIKRYDFRSFNQKHRLKNVEIPFFNRKEALIQALNHLSIEKSNQTIQQNIQKTISYQPTHLKLIKLSQGIQNATNFNTTSFNKLRVKTLTVPKIIRISGGSVISLFAMSLPFILDRLNKLNRIPKIPGSPDVWHIFMDFLNQKKTTKSSSAPKLIVLGGVGVEVGKRILEKIWKDRQEAVLEKKWGVFAKLRKFMMDYGIYAILFFVVILLRQPIFNFFKLKDVFGGTINKYDMLASMFEKQLNVFKEIFAHGSKTGENAMKETSSVNKQHITYLKENVLELKTKLDTCTSNKDLLIQNVHSKALEVQTVENGLKICETTYKTHAINLVYRMLETIQSQNPLMNIDKVLWGEKANSELNQQTFSAIKSETKKQPDETARDKSYNWAMEMTD